MPRYAAGLLAKRLLDGPLLPSNGPDPVLVIAVQAFQTRVQLHMSVSTRVSIASRTKGIVPMYARFMSALCAKSAAQTLAISSLAPCASMQLKVVGGKALHASIHKIWYNNCEMCGINAAGAHSAGMHIAAILVLASTCMALTSSLLHTHLLSLQLAIL